MAQESRMLASIKFLSGPLTDTTFSISKSITTIGRDKSNDIVVPDPKISEFHANLIYSDGVWKIEKVFLTSSIIVNKRGVEQAILSDNITIGLGSTISFLFSLSPAASEQREEVTLPTRLSAHEYDTNPDSEPRLPAHEYDTRPTLEPRLPAHEYDTSPTSEESHVETLLIAKPQEVETVLITKAQEAAQSVKAKQSPSSPEQNRIAPKTQIASFSEMGISSLEITDNTTGAKQMYPLMQEVINIGQDPQNTIVINTVSVSDLHCQIFREKNQWVIVHPHPNRQQTQNGLLYQGRAIPGSDTFRKPLNHGDVFRIGDEHGNLVTLTYRSSNGPREALSRIEPFHLGAAECTIGRLEDNDVVLNHPQVSAHHVRLIQEQGTYRLLDLASTNHTYVNGLRVNSQLLQPQDEIRIGPFRFIYTYSELAQFDESGGIRIDALNLKKVGNNQTILLNDISLSIPSRSFVALVGGSGAGKTTLLDALSGLRPAQEGSVFYNGQDYYQNLATFSSQLGYVPQDDIIHRDLTVERALYFAAKLRLPRDFLEEQIQQRIDEVLDDVEMKHRRTLPISQLSGGQRKRVSIALELLAKPSIFFLDEPTSGLDPGLDRKMMILLRTLADKGHTILLVTHATNNINVCDYVCFLAQGGNLSYFGPPEEAKAYFRQPDFAEIYSVLEPGDGGQAIPLKAKEKFEQSRAYEKYISEHLAQKPKVGTQALHEQKKQQRARPRKASWRQFLLLTRRYLELQKNDKVNLAILLLQAPVIGLLLLLFIKGSSPDGFNANTILQCPATAAIVSVRGYPDVPTPDNPVVSKSCQQVEIFLASNPRGKTYASTRGGTIEALQDFMLPGPGFAITILFLMAFSSIMFGCINAIREVVKESPIYRRERAVNLGILPYMFSKIVVLGLLCLLQSLILVGFVALFDPFSHSVFLPAFLEIYITVALTSLTGLMMGLTISAIAPNNDRAASFVPLLLLPQVIFSGTLFPLTNWFIQYLSLLFPIRWAIAALGSSVGLHSDKLNGDQLFGQSYTYHGTLFSTYSQQDATQYLLLMWLALVIMIVLFGITTGYFLKRKDIRA